MSRAARLLRLAAALLIGAIAGSNAFAVATTWTGAVSTEWNTGGNWNTGNVPTTADDVTIPANVASGRYPVVSTADANAKKLTLATGAGTPPTLTVSAQTLTTVDDFSVNAGTVTHSGGTIKPLKVLVTGTFNETGGTYLGADTFTVKTGGTVNVSSTGVIHMANALATSPTDNIVIEAGATFNQSASTVATKDFTTTSGSPNGTYSQTGGTFKMYHDFKGTGTFNATGGTIQFAAAGGGGSFPATLGPTQFNNVVCDVDPNFDNQDASFNVIGNWTANAAIDMSGHAVNVTFNGTGTQTIGGSGTTTFSILTLDKPSSTIALSTMPNASDKLVLASGALTLSTGSPTIGGIEVNGGTLTLAGPSINPSTITVASGATLTHTAGTVTATGAISISGTLNESSTLLNANTLTVNSGGNLNVTGSGIVHMASSLGTNPTDNIVIAAGGTITQSGGTVATKDFTTTAGSPNGTYNQSGGTFKMYHDFKSNGTFNATGGTIQFAAAGGGGTFPATLGPTQFYNVLVDVDPNFDTQDNVSFSVAGDWTANDAIDMSGKVITVVFNGTGAQAIGGSQITTFRNLTVNKSSGTATLAGNQTVKSGDLTVSAGTLDLSSYTLNRSAAGGTITVSNGATLKIGGTNSFPTNYTTHTLGATSTVNYSGTNQTVTLESYGHLTLSGSGTKTMPGSAMTVAGNFTMSGTASATAAQALTVNGNFTLDSGTTFGAASYSHGVKGNFSNSGTFTASTSTFTLNGTSAQTIGGSNASTFNALTINNASGVSLSGVDATAGGTLTFTSGNVATSSNALYVSSTGSVSRTSGHVVGNFKKYVATGATSRTFEVGDASNYSPVTVAFGSVTVAGDLTTSTTAGDHPNIATSLINASKSANRHWTMSNSGISFNNYNATFTFVAGDLDAGASTSSFIVGKYSGGSWSWPTVGTRTSTSTQITGATSFSDFQCGEALTALGNGTDPSNASLAPGGAATMADAFTFQTSSSDTVTAVTVTLASGTSAGLSLVEITDDAGSTVYGSAANPGSDTPSITLTTNITVTQTAMQYKIRITPKSHTNMPAPAGATYSVTAYVSNWTGTNAHGGSDSGGTTVTIDNLSPGNVTSATVTAGNSQNSLAWTNPADSDLGSIVVLRRAGSAVGDTPVEGTTYTAGDTIGSSTVACVVAAPTAACTDTGLTNDTAYHYKIFAKDTNGNYATGVVPTGSPATPRGVAVLTITKVSAVISDPSNGTTNPLRIPGSVIEYSVTPSNTGNGSPDTATVYVTDPIDSTSLAFSVGAGVTFVDGTTTSGLALGTVTYSSTAAPGPYVYNYTPVPDGNGYDGNVTAIKVATSGVFAHSGSPAPSFTLKFRLKVK